MRVKILKSFHMGGVPSVQILPGSVIELPADIYYITKVPVELKLVNILATAVVSYVLCMLSAVYPALRASKVSPIDAIRYG